MTSFGSMRKDSVLVLRSVLPVPVTRTSGPARRRSLVSALPFSMRKLACNSVRSVVCASFSCQPDSVLEVRLRIICATLMPRICAVLEIDIGGAGQVGDHLALVAAVDAHVELRLHLAVERGEVGRAGQQRQRAHAAQFGAHGEDRSRDRCVEREAGRGLAFVKAEFAQRHPQDAAARASLRSSPARASACRH